MGRTLVKAGRVLLAGWALASVGCTPGASDGDRLELTRGALTAAAPKLIAVATAANTVKTYWNDVAGSTGFFVDRSTNGGTSWSQILLLAAGTTQWTDGSRAYDTAYCYRVRAVPTTAAPTSNTACVTTPFGFEGETVSQTLSGGTSSIVSDPAASNGHYFLADPGNGGTADLALIVPVTGRYEVKVTYAVGPDRGLAQLSVDGAPVGGPGDGYAATPGYVEADLGEIDLQATTARTFRFLVTGKNAASSAFRVGVDVIRLYPHGQRFEAEASGSIVSSGDSHTITNDAAASAGKLDVARLNAAGDFQKVTLPVSLPGDYILALRYKTGPDRGRFQTIFNTTTNVGPVIDGYAATPGYVTIEVGTVHVAAYGNYEVRLSVTGKNGSSSSFGTSLDFVDLRLPRHTQQLSGHRFAGEQGAPLVGPLPPSTVVPITVELQLQNAAQVHTLAAAVSDPSNPQYLQFLTPAAFAATYGPTLASYQALQDYLTSRGFTVVASDSEHILLKVSGTAAQAEQAFFVNLNVYQRADGSTFVAPDQEPALDVATPVLFLAGLDTFPRLLPPPDAFVFGTGMNSSYRPPELRSAYASCALPLGGEGQCVDIIGQGGFNSVDITAFEHDMGLADAQLVPIVGAQSTEAPNSEVTLDIEMALAMAPHLDAVVMYGIGSLDPQDDLVTALKNIASGAPRLCKQVSSSFEWVQIPQQFYQPSLDRMAMQGQSFFQSSGDHGKTGFGADTIYDLANITYVGETALSMATSSTGAIVYGKEDGWQDSGAGFVDCPNSVYLKGDGTCLPDFQAGVANASNQASATQRNIPDVSLIGGGVGVQTFETIGGVHGTVHTEGGTSVATPLWAGFTALINERRQAAGVPSLGFPNPTLYGISKVPSVYATVFNDVSDGNNGFPGVAGYDLVSGIGTPKCNLIYQLASTTPIVAAQHVNVHVTGSLTVTVSFSNQPDVTTVQPVDQHVILGVDNPSQDVTAIASAAVEAVGDVFLTLAPNNADVQMADLGFVLGPASVNNVFPPGTPPFIIHPGGASLTEGTTVTTGVPPTDAPVTSAKMTVSFTIQSVQQP